MRREKQLTAREKARKRSTYEDEKRATVVTRQFNQRSSPSNGGGFPFSMSSSPLGAGVGGGIGGAPVSGSPPNFSHFAGSKCYDAPAPTALPKPPVHWTTIGSGAGGASSSSTSSLSMAMMMAPSGNQNSKKSLAGVSTGGVLKQQQQFYQQSQSQQQQQSRLRTKAMKSCASAAAKVSNRHAAVFTHSLKTILNVQA